MVTSGCLDICVWLRAWVTRDCVLIECNNHTPNTVYAEEGGGDRFVETGPKRTAASDT